MPVSVIINANSAIGLMSFPDNHFDAVVTDPPYGLAFMNKHWDYDVPNVELWKEVLRVLKPGGHLLSFGGTRTYHRMVVNIEDAGFEIRDQLQWIYSTGFPKSMDISKAIDKAAGAAREIVGTKETGKDAPTGKGTMQLSKNTFTDESGKNVFNLTAPATDAAKQWEGWGTALKPANEPIVLARKPISESTVAANILKWGTGGIYIDGCRIGETGARNNGSNADINGYSSNEVYGKYKAMEAVDYNKGRFPANIIFDEAAASMLDEQSGQLTSGAAKPVMLLNKKGWAGDMPDQTNYSCEASSGGASRFFYVAKPDGEERSRGLGKRQAQIVNDGREKDIDNAFQRGTTRRKNIHPTVKPVDLMRYLIRLITPPNGHVLDPFNGSGTTGIAAALEMKSYTGFEIDPEYCEISRARIKAWPAQAQLF